MPHLISSLFCTAALSSFGINLSGYDSPAFLIPAPNQSKTCKAKQIIGQHDFEKYFYLTIRDVLPCYFLCKIRGSNLTFLVRFWCFESFWKIHYCLKIIWVSNSLWGQLWKNITSFLLARPGVWYSRIIKSEQNPILIANFWFVVNQYCVRVAVGLLYPNGGEVQNKCKE